MEKPGTSEQLAFGFALLMLISIFLPWSRISMLGEMDQTGISYYPGPSVPGIYFFTGFLSLILTLTSILLIFFWKKGAVIAAVVNLIVAGFHIFGPILISTANLSEKTLSTLIILHTSPPYEPEVGPFLFCVATTLFIIQVYYCMHKTRLDDEVNLHDRL